MKSVIFLMLLLFLTGCGATNKEAIPPKIVATFGTFQWDGITKTITIQVLPYAGTVDLPQFNGQIVDVTLVGRY